MNMSRFFQMKKMVNMSGGSTSKVCGSNSMMHLVNTKGSSSSYSKQWLFFAEVRQGHIHLDPSGLRSTVPFSDKLQCQRTNIELIFLLFNHPFLPGKNNHLEIHGNHLEIHGNHSEIHRNQPQNHRNHPENHCPNIILRLRVEAQAFPACLFYSQTVDGSGGSSIRFKGGTDL
jgi:hypothetical protein